MHICRRLHLKCVPPALAAMVMVPPSVAHGQPTDGHGREDIAQQGEAALERLKSAVGKQTQPPAAASAITLPPLPDDERRRAFDALAKRVRTPALEARAVDALAEGVAAVASERDAAARRIGQALGLDAADIQALSGAASPLETKSWVPILFISSSMPVATLRTYAQQLERVNGIFALRGMPGGLTKVGPMARLSAKILRVDPGCEGPACTMRAVQLIIDPILFRHHHVAQVPALAMVPGDPTLPYCERDDDSPIASHIVYGDAALSGLFAQYARLGGAREVADAQARLDPR